jgi:TldD protein
MFSIESLLPSSLEKVSRLVGDALRAADDGELFLEHKTSESVGLRDGVIRSAAANQSQGFGLRAVCGESTFYAHSGDISERQLAQAKSFVQSFALSGKPVALAPTRLVSLPVPGKAVSFQEQVAFLQAVDAYIRSLDSRVIQVSAFLSHGIQDVLILRKEASCLKENRLRAVLQIKITVEEGGRREHGSVSVGGRQDLAALLEPGFWQAQSREALRLACLALEAIPVQAGVMPVILGQGSPGVLLHEAVGHGLEADFNRKGQSIYAGQMGQRIASPGVTVIDDGSRGSGLSHLHGALAMDDEGTATQATTLIEDGILVGHMCDSLNGRLMGKGSTGNGRRQSYAHMPMPRMTNTYMQAGSGTLEEMLASVKRGIYAVSFDGGQVDIVSGNFVFGTREAYLVEGGKIVAPIKEATLIGNGPEVMQKIQMIGQDLAMDTGVGMCGKNGQSVPVGIGQPSLLISELTVGGAG